MQINTDVETTTDTNAQLGSVRMGFDESALGHLTSLLTNLYNNPNGAVFREYVANALDATEQAGSDEPIRIWMPTNSTPMFRVQDFGIGMTMHDVQTIYSQYGASTKNKDNSSIGGFGLGCKSGLAIASQFTVTTTRDGKKVTAIIHSNDGDVPSLEYLPEQHTTDPNGTTVSVPVPDANRFITDSQKYLTFLDDNKYSVMNFSSRYDTNLSTEIDEIGSHDDVVVYNNPIHYNFTIDYGIYVVMGGIYYYINNAQLPNISTTVSDFVSNTVVVLDAPIGSVDLSPNRESVQFTNKTREYLKCTLVSAFDSILDSIIGEVEDCTNLKDALTVVDDYSPIRCSVSKMIEDMEFGVPISKYTANTARNVVISNHNGENYFKSSYCIISDEGQRSSSSDMLRASINYTMVINDKNISQRTFTRNVSEYCKESGINSGEFFLVHSKELRVYSHYSHHYDDKYDIISIDDLHLLVGEDNVIKYSTITEKAKKWRKDNKPTTPTKKRKILSDFSGISAGDGTEDGYLSIEDDELPDTLYWVESPAPRYIHKVVNAPFVCVQKSVSPRRRESLKKLLESRGIDLLDFDLKKGYNRWLKDLLKQITPSQAKSVREVSEPVISNQFAEFAEEGRVKDKKLAKDILTHKLLKKLYVDYLNLKELDYLKRLTKSEEKKLVGLLSIPNNTDSIGFRRKYPLVGNYYHSEQEFEDLLLYINAKYQDTKKKERKS